MRFSEADEVGAEFISGAASELLSWNDTQIVVQVNEGAGTGPIQVVRSTGEQITSSQSLTVNYALTNVEYQSEFYRTQHIDKNGNGGEQFTGSTYACRPPGVYHGPFKSENGCILFELHYYKNDKKF